MKHIVIFASGSGSNAENIIQHFAQSSIARVVAVFSNNPEAGVLARAAKHGIPAHTFNRAQWTTGEAIDSIIASYNPDCIALAGFLWLFPERLVHKYEGHVLNIHPALLPKYGGKGMYGDKVHRAVLAAGEQRHGVTVHYVNAAYDEGKILLQESFEVLANETLDNLTHKIHALEYILYPKAIEQFMAQ
jgi:phosphoribosylglycinamide formyltransferase-1